MLRLHKIMKQNDVHFINILNRFQITSDKNENIHFTNDFCLTSPPMDNTLPQLFYTTFKPMPIINMYITKHLVKHLSFLQKIVILKHVLFISNCPC